MKKKPRSQEANDKKIENICKQCRPGRFIALEKAGHSVKDTPCVTHAGM